ncbi:MAG: RluA family pseudouridine synthase, partial [Nitrospirota bacterium]|nr:RluA family pseudouridine synthase [Nitrospirota bacterium]
SGLVDFLVGMGYSKTKVKQLLKHRAIAVNKKVVTGHDHLLSVGDMLSLDSKPEPGKDILDKYDIEVLHEDDAVMVINKPSGLLTIATESEKRETAYYLLNAYFKERNPSRPDRIFIVHRLDRETSGLLVFAKNEAIKKKLQDEWEKAEKKYFTVVEGVPKQREGKIESHLNETKAFKVYSDAMSDQTKHAVTRYKVIKSDRTHALLDIILDTGRKHQIRVHLSDLGCPIVGDKKYGAVTNPIRRIALHAYSLTFTHPVTKKRMQFSTPIPPAFGSLVKNMS